MAAATSEVSIEKLAVPILRDTEGGLYDATTIRNIVEMIDSITMNVSYSPSRCDSSSQFLDIKKE